MRTISDRDLGIDSDFVAEGDTDDEVIEIMRDHIQNEFPDQYDRVRGMLAMYIKDSEKNTQEGRDNTDEMGDLWLLLIINRNLWKTFI